MSPSLELLGGSRAIRILALQCLLPGGLASCPFGVTAKVCFAHIHPGSLSPESCLAELALVPDKGIPAWMFSYTVTWFVSVNGVIPLTPPVSRGENSGDRRQQSDSP